MIGVSSDSYESYMNFIRGSWFDNKVVDCSLMGSIGSIESIECNKKYSSSIEEINNEYKLKNKVVYNKYNSNKKKTIQNNKSLLYAYRKRTIGTIN